MTDLRKAAEDLLEDVEAAIKAGDWKVDGACDPDSAIHALRTALAQPDEVLAEREACAKICDEQAEKDKFEGCYANACAEAIRARSEKRPVKSYCGGKPNYCTPEQGNSSPNYPISESSTPFVDTVNTSQARVEYDRQGNIARLFGPIEPDGTLLYAAPPKREWVGLTDAQVEEIAEYHGIDCLYETSRIDFYRAIEVKLKEKNI
jgi:hypothetical protein